MDSKASIPQYDKDEAVLHPDGAHLMYWGWDGPKLVLEAYPGGGETEFALSRDGDVDFPKDSNPTCKVIAHKYKCMPWIFAHPYRTS